MRKIGANYILLPGYPLVKYGYVLLSEAGIVDVVDTGGMMKEIQGLEFYGGMIVAGDVTVSSLRVNPGDSFLPLLDNVYEQRSSDNTGLALVEGADLTAFVFLKGTTIKKIR